jgi:hypothetical protein
MPKSNQKIKYKIKEVVFYPDYYYEDDVPEEVALMVRPYVDKKVAPHIKEEKIKTSKERSFKKKNNKH